MNKKIKLWLTNKDLLNQKYNSYISKKIISKTPSGKNLIEAHLEKTQHNLEFSQFLIKNNKYLDWSIVGLYYSIYHASLALVINKGHTSKDHSATLCFLIKHYTQITKEEIKLVEHLQITKTDIETYSKLKSERQKASYSTVKQIELDKIKTLRKEVILFINKIKTILSQNL
jgi:uncharacterized protein (UPF0332 family)